MQMERSLINRWYLKACTWPAKNETIIRSWHTAGLATQQHKQMSIGDNHAIIVNAEIALN
jgi:hypothetical protein